MSVWLPPGIMESGGSRSTNSSTNDWGLTSTLPFSPVLGAENRELKYRIRAGSRGKRKLRKQKERLLLPHRCPSSPPVDQLSALCLIVREEEGDRDSTKVVPRASVQTSLHLRFFAGAQCVKCALLESREWVFCPNFITCHFSYETGRWHGRDEPPLACTF